MDPSGMTFYRGACTDPKFNDQACGQFCLDEKNDIEAVWVCNNGRQYACGSTIPYNSCYGNLVTIVGGDLIDNPTVDSVLNITSGTSSAASALASASSTSSTSSNSTSQDHQCPSHVGVYAGIGAGLGVPLLIALLLLGFLFYKIRQMRKSNDASRSLGPPPTSQMPPTYRYTNDFQQSHSSSTGSQNPAMPSHYQAGGRHELGGGYDPTKRY